MKYAHIVVFVAVFLFVVFIVLRCNKRTDNSKDLHNWIGIITKKDNKIDTWIICPHRSKPQKQEGLKDAEYKYPAEIYRVESRFEFDNCQLNNTNKSAVVECDDRSKESLSDGIALNVILDEFEERKEYYFLSVSSSDRPKDRVDGVCDDSILRVSITIDSNLDEYFKVSENSKFTKGIISLMVLILIMIISMLVFWFFCKP